MKLNQEEIEILINLVEHEMEWAGNDKFYEYYKKQLSKIKNKLEKGE